MPQLVTYSPNWAPLSLPCKKNVSVNLDLGDNQPVPLTDVVVPVLNRVRN